MSDTLPEGVVRAMDGYQGVVIDYAHDACHLSQMRSARARAEDAIAAHVAAEVAAERARCVVPEVVREAVDDGIHTLEAEAHKAEDMRRFEKAQSRRIAAAQCRAWLAALPPITPEGT